MSHQITLGEPASYLTKDAVHIAVVGLIAGHTLYPGQRIKLLLGDRGGPAVAAKRMEDSVAVVDPFLVAPVTVGVRFWALMLPGTVTNLRHEWDHPLVSGSPAEASEAYEGCRGC